MEQLTEMENATNRRIPAKLYKYRNTGEYTERIFKMQELYFAAPDQFNDPFDCGFHILCSGEANQQVLESGAFETVREKHPEWSLEESLDAAKQVGAAMASDRLEDTTQVFLDKLAADTNRKAGILSLSERNDDILMWSHYADCHEGICIEFSTDVGSSLFTQAEPVVYSDKYPHLSLRDVVTNEEMREAADWMLTKSVHWEYEKEWRVIDFDAGPGVQDFPAEGLSGMILGCRIPADEKKKVMQWVSAMPHSVAIYQAKESPTHFRLNIEQIV